MISLADYSNYQDRLNSAQFWLQLSSRLFLYQLHFRFAGRTSAALIPSVHWWGCRGSRLTGCSRHAATLSRSHQSFHSQMERSRANSPPSKFWICLRLSSYLEAYAEEFSTWKMSNGPAGLIRSSSRSRSLWGLGPSVIVSRFCGLTSCYCAQDVNNLNPCMTNMKIPACLLMLADRRFYLSDHSQSNFSLSCRVGNTPTKCGSITCYILWMEAAPPRSSEQTTWVLTGSSVRSTHVEPQAMLDIRVLEKQWRCSWVCIPDYSRTIT